MSDYTDMDRYLNLDTSTSPSPCPPSPPAMGIFNRPQPETAGSFLKMPAPQQPLSEHASAPNMEGTLHHADDPFAQMTLQENALYRPYRQPMYRMVPSSSADHGTDEVNLHSGDASTCGSGISHLTLSSPANSWTSPATSVTPYRNHDDHWNDLSLSSPSYLSSTDDGDDLAAAPSPVYCPGHDFSESPESTWELEHNGAQPLSNFVGMSVNSAPPSPVDGLCSSARSFMGSQVTDNPDMVGAAGLDDDHYRFRSSEPCSLAAASSSSPGAGATANRSTTSSSADGPPYAQLIYQALMSRDDHCMSLQEIYSWFRDNTDKAKGGGKGWQNSIRHNLSMNRWKANLLTSPKGFIKRERKEAQNCAQSLPPSPSDASNNDPKRSTEWTLQDWAIVQGIQSTTRYRGSKAKGSSKGSHSRQTSSPGSPYPPAAAAANRNSHSHIHGSRGPRFPQRHGGSAGSAHGSMRLPPTSHYYPQPSLPDHASHRTGPYREQLMHEAMMRDGGYVNTARSSMNMESRPSTPPSAVDGGASECYPVVGLPGLHHHGLMRPESPSGVSNYPLAPNSTSGGQFPCVPQSAEFPFTTSHVQLYPSRGNAASEDGNGEQQSSASYDANGPQGLYPWNPNSGY